MPIQHDSIIPQKLAITSIILIVVITILSDFLLKGDIIETLYLGKDLSLFYSKHPPVTFWLTNPLIHNIPSDILLAASTLILYSGYALISYIGWRLARVYFTDKRVLALVPTAIALSLFSKYIYFTPDFMAILLSSLCLWLLYYSITTDRLIYWLSFCFCALLFFFSKYQAIVSFVAFLMTLILTPLGRERLQSKNFWLIVVIGASLIIPYSLFVIFQDVSSFSYAKTGAGMDTHFNLFKGLTTPFAVAFLPILLGIIFFSKEKIAIGWNQYIEKAKAWSFETSFILINSIGFLLSWIIFCIIFNHELQTRFTIQNIIPFTILFFSILLPLTTSLSSAKIKITIGILISLSTLVFGIKAFKQNNWTDLEVRRQAYSFISKDIGQPIDYILLDYRSFDRFYLAFDEKPYVRILDYTATDDVIREIDGKTSILLWKKDQDMDWVDQFKQHYPKISQPKSITLRSKDKELMGIPLPESKFEIYYAYISH